MTDDRPPEGWELDPTTDTVEIEVTDTLDLHSFPPSEVREIVVDYLDLAQAAGFTQIRLIHGRGKGVQRRMIRSLLERDARVAAFGDAPMGAGGWGATLVQLKPGPDS